MTHTRVFFIGSHQIIAMTNLKETDVPIPIPIWNVGNKYRKGDKVSYRGFLYKCHLEHVAISSWSPNSAPMVWSLIGSLQVKKATHEPPRTDNTYPKYVQVPIPKITRENIIKQLRMNVIVTFTGDGRYTTAVTSSSATYV